jgi:hypothetical protein
MTPRRVLPYLLLFLALAGAYLGLKWRQDRRQAREQEAGKVFAVKEGEISELALIKGKEEIRLVRRDQDWEITRPLKDRADPEVIAAMLTTLAHLQRERDLGTVENLKPFGLETPALEATFTAQGKAHRLLIGGKAPGERSYYALRGQKHRVLLINAGDKESLDRPLTALRDKTLIAFKEEQVKALKLKVGNLQVELTRTGPGAWRWVGREGLPVRGDRVELLLRQLQDARVEDFAAESPQSLTAYGLAPRPQAEVVVTTVQGPAVLYLGSRAKDGVYARRGTAGPVVVVDPDLPGKIAKTAGSLEDRRLWTGSISEVEKVVWGPAARPWTAVKENDFWKLTGPAGQDLRQHAARLELALRHLQDLEAAPLLPGAAPPGGQKGTVLTLYDGAGKPLFRLEEKGKKGDKELEVRAQQGEKAVRAMISAKDYEAWQGELERLTVPPRKADGGRAP